MNQSPKTPRPRPLIRVILGAIGRATVTVIQVFGATIKAVSGGGNAPLMPPSTEPLPKRQDNRP